jgi:hypothetical protein
VKPDGAGEMTHRVWKFQRSLHRFGGSWPAWRRADAQQPPIVLWCSPGHDQLQYDPYRIYVESTRGRPQEALPARPTPPGRAGAVAREWPPASMAPPRVLRESREPALEADRSTAEVAKPKADPIRESRKHPVHRMAARGTPTCTARSYGPTLCTVFSAAPSGAQVAERVGFEPTRGVNP